MPWGLGMGVHESIIPAAVAPFRAGYGIFWFIGSALIR
jgi:hypothetical protein